jgi:hypothetical protein
MTAERRPTAGRGTVQLDLLDVLEDALMPKRDGTRHHYACLNRHMNASDTPCSDRCVKANGLLAAHAPARRPAAGRTAS